MNDIDYLKEDFNYLDDRVSNLETVKQSRPYFLYGQNGTERVCIAMFSTEDNYKKFVASCELKTKKKEQKYKKNSPMYGFERFYLEREYIPCYVPYDPIFEQQKDIFKKDEEYEES